MNIIYLAVTVAFGLLFRNSFKDPELKNVKPENIFRDFLFQHFKKNKIGVSKSKITKVINEQIIPNFDVFKIGKTGNPNRRIKEHSINYDKIFLLCKSKYPEYIVELESYYNYKYFDHYKNENKIKGSSGANSSVDGFYYLYVAVK